MGKGDGNQQLVAAKRAFQHAKAEGNRQEEARWANVIGDILKNRGEYIKALRWLRIDYDISIKYLPEKQLLPSCQSLGEVYLRLQDYEHALVYQKKHLDLAKDENNLIEQQRATTQLGRTYHEMFLKSDDDHCSLKNAKKYFKLAMELAQTLKHSQLSERFSFVKEYIDAHNNLGMLEMDLDNLEEAKKFLLKGLEICDEEELSENDDGRSRLHHNLGNVYTELRKWDKAREHIRKDIVICSKIGHCQGEAKGYINLGELHYRVQRYDEAMTCYNKALQLAKSMEDEDALIDQINQNMQTVREALKVRAEMEKEEQVLKKMVRKMEMARETDGERKCLLQQYSSLDHLIEKASIIFAWMKYHAYAKKKKKIASQLYDTEKLGDSFLAIGESYHKLRKFDKALKWYTKSLEKYKLIGNLEGQALAKISIGNTFDSKGDWASALAAYKEGYSISVKANKPATQLAALENMHYSQMIRFDNVEEARRLQLSIDKLKQSQSKDLGVPDLAGDLCSETETEADQSPDGESDMSFSPTKSEFGDKKSEFHATSDHSYENLPLTSLLDPNKKLAKLKTTSVARTKPPECSPRSLSKSSSSQTETISRKRTRIILSDDEDENDEVHCSGGIVNPGAEDNQAFSSHDMFHKFAVEDVATSDDFKVGKKQCNHTHEVQVDASPVASKCKISACAAINIEESTCSEKSRTSRLDPKDRKDIRFSSPHRAVENSNFSANGKVLHASNACGDEHCKHIIVKIGEDYIHIEQDSCIVGSDLSIEQMKIEVACMYYLQLPAEKRSKGLVPVIQHVKYEGRVLESFEAIDILDDHISRKSCIEVSLGVWVPKPLVELYTDCCKELSESPNMKVLKKLYNQEVSEDEIVVSGCELQDISVAPLVNALNKHQTVASLDLSHNLLGNGTMEKLKKVFTSSHQSYGGLALDLHCNRFGPTALFQVCECHVLYSRLEVLNISRNRLTDACACYLSTILQKCKALYSLNIEQCSITSRTVQKVADSLDSGSALTHLCLGYNHPVSGNAMINVLAKLANLNNFQELNLSGVKLSKPVVDKLCELVKNTSLSDLILGSTSIGNDGALKILESFSEKTRETGKLDLSSCGLTSVYIARFNIEVSLMSSILELNLGGNPIMEEGGNELASLLSNPQCCLRVLILCKCQLGLVNILGILKGLSENCHLEELNLAENAHFDEIHTYPNRLKSKSEPPIHHKVEASEQEICTVNMDYSQLEVADSEDDAEEGASIYKRTGTTTQDPSNSEWELIEELSTAIKMAKHLQQLDLSSNGFCQEAGQRLYSAWTLQSRCGIAQKHIEGNVIHLSVQGTKCCGTKPCCQRV
nr:protein TONSOKU [Ipomoea batatas]